MLIRHQCRSLKAQNLNNNNKKIKIYSFAQIKKHVCFQVSPQNKTFCTLITRIVLLICVFSVFFYLFLPTPVLYITWSWLRLRFPRLKFSVSNCKATKMRLRVPAQGEKSPKEHVPKPRWERAAAALWTLVFPGGTNVRFFLSYQQDSFHPAQDIRQSSPSAEDQFPVFPDSGSITGSAHFIAVLSWIHIYYGRRCGFDLIKLLYCAPFKRHKHSFKRDMYLFIYKYKRPLVLYIKLMLFKCI